MRYDAPVIRGHGRGASLIGYPTFNLRIPEVFSLPFGIYAAWVWISDVRYAGAMHYGPIPTFDERTPSLELFVLDYDSAEPVATLGFEVKDYLREIRNFDSLQGLHDQISEDVEKTRALLI